MTITVTLIFAVLSYLIGSVNFSIILSRIMSGKDIRESGSGNAGATNMLRTYGKKMGVITLLLDILKGVLVVLLASFAVKKLSAAGYIPYIAGVCVVLGHNFPLYFGFKGGKGVATSLGVVLVLDPIVGLIVMVAAVLIIAVTRYVSLGSVVGGALFIIAEAVKMIAAGEFDIIVMVCCVILGGLLIVRHHANIKRLLSGTENKLGAKGGDK